MLSLTSQYFKDVRLKKLKRKLNSLIPSLPLCQSVDSNEIATEGLFSSAVERQTFNLVVKAFDHQIKDLSRLLSFWFWVCRYAC